MKNCARRRYLWLISMLLAADSPLWNFAFAQEFEDDVETWRGSISAVNQCGDHITQEFPHYEAGELKSFLAEVNDRWNNVTNR